MTPSKSLAEHFEAIGILHAKVAARCNMIAQELRNDGPDGPEDAPTDAEGSGQPATSTAP